MTEPNEQRPHDGSRLLVYFHGHGSRAEILPDFLRQRGDDSWVRLCPDAPVAEGGGFSWFDSGPRGVDRQSLETSLGLVAVVLDSVTTEMGVPRERVVLGGFSQGGAFALALAARQPTPIGGLLLQSAFVPEGLDTEVDLDAIAPTAVMLHHSRNDDVVPVHASQDIAAALRERGHCVEFELHDVGHTIDAAILASTKTWLDGFDAEIAP